MSRQHLLHQTAVLNVKTVFDSCSALTMSVPKSIHKMVIVPRGRGILTMMKNRNGVISGMLLVKV